MQHIEAPVSTTPLTLGEAAHLIAALQRELRTVIIGQDAVVDEILTAFLAGGHCLLRGVPGLAKTLLIKSLADAVHRLRNVDGLATIYLDQSDIVRNPLVTRIVKAYEEDAPRVRKPAN